MDAKKALAHISEDGARTQTVVEHLEGTARLAAEFARAFGNEDMGHLVGILHDIGKLGEGFQRRLLGSSESVDHSTAGAKEAGRLPCLPAAFAIAGHHSGLPDGGNKTDTAQDGTLHGRFQKELDSYESWKTVISPPSVPVVPPYLRSDLLALSFYTRMIYSCLVDADFLDTEEFMLGHSPMRGGYDSIPELLARLRNYIAPWQTPSNALNARRNQILQACLEQGSQADRGLFTLTVPTGGGKTVASLAFALSMAAAKKMDRIIYVIPYTSIIDQTAAVFADIVGSENVLAHYSCAEYGADENASPAQYRKALACENWDAPIIVTTSVQFFESIYSNRSSRCRKLHNIANSVIIFDEAQNLPLTYLRPCVAAIAELVQHYKASAVLCTATQPALLPIFAEFAPGLTAQELCPEPKQQYLAFRRTHLQFCGKIEQNALSQKLSSHEQVLCIVNRRKTAQEIYGALPEDGSYCLTTLLYPAHRKQLLQQIRARLQDGLPCRVISTSLIEAGVDVDFPVVYREEAGLDSILQSAGRCNREGKHTAEESPVFVFQLQSMTAPPMIKTNISTARSIFSKFADPASLEAIEEYFLLYRRLKGSDSLDAKGILPLFQSITSLGIFPFATVSEQFHLIESPTTSVYIPLGEAKALIDQLQSGNYSRSLFRKLGQYAVPVYPDHLQKLTSAGAVQKIADDFWVLADFRCYNEHTGLSMDVESGSAWFI